MNAFQQQMVPIDRIIIDFHHVIGIIRPTKKDLRWFAHSQTTIHQHRIKKGTEDLLNHAASLIGYFEGYESRGQFQIESAKIVEEHQPTILLELFDFILKILDIVQQSIQSLISKDTLTLAPNGPRKPGPERTLLVCKSHILSLEEQICLLTILVTKDPVHKQKVQHHVDAIQRMNAKPSSM